MAEGRVAEQRTRCYEDVWDDDGGEVPFQFLSVLEHGQGEGDDGDVEDGAEDVAGAWWGEVGAFVGEELGVARFGVVGCEGGVEGGAGGEGEEPD